jgi:hypothetical protein
MSSVEPFGSILSRNGLRRPSTSQYSCTIPASAASGLALEYRHRPGEDSYSSVWTDPGTLRQPYTLAVCIRSRIAAISSRFGP